MSRPNSHLRLVDHHPVTFPARSHPPRLRLVPPVGDPASWKPLPLHRAAVRFLARPAPSKTTGGQALLIAIGMFAAGTLAQRWGLDRGAGAARAEAARELAEVRRRHQEAVAQTAHDLRTPLTALKGHAQLLQRHLRTGAADPERLRVGLGQIDAAATAASRRLDGLTHPTVPPDSP